MENIIHNFSNAIGWSILHSLWQGASLYLMLFGIYLTFPQMSSSIKYKIAFIGQSLLFISFIYTFHTYLSFQDIKTENIKLNEQEELILYITYLKDKTWTITQLFPYIVTLYTIGLLVQVTLFIKSLHTLHRIRKNSSAVIPSQWQQTLNSVINRTKISPKIRLMVSDQITSAITVGFLRPMIVFPTAYINNISKEEAEEILLHELAHIKRYDYLFNILLIVIETLLFFNPFVWLISKHVKLEREQSCDDFVGHHLKNPISYSKTLLKVELLRQEAITQFAMAASGNNNYSLLNRIKRINNRTMETKYTSVKHQLLAILLTSVALLSIAWINPKASIEQKSALIPDLQENCSIEKIIIPSSDTIKLLKPTNNVRINKENDLKEGKETSDLQKQLITLDKSNTEIQKHFESAEWKEQIKGIELNAKKIEEQFNSPEWKEQIKGVELNAKKIEEQLNSPEWKDKIAKIELNAKKIEEQFNSPEWKEKIAKIELNSEKIEILFNSPEWKEKINIIQAINISIDQKNIGEKRTSDIKQLKK